MSNLKTNHELSKWPILTMLDSELIATTRMAYVCGMSGNEAFIVTTDDNVYALGSNESGCLGIGVMGNALYATEVEPLCGEGVTKFVCSGWETPFILALTKTGKVFSWGCNDKHQLGIGTNINHLTPVEVPLKKLVTNIACGYHHSLAVTNEGQVYAWGFNGNGVIGNGTTSEIDEPYKLGDHFNGEKIVSIACTASSSFAVTETGKVYSWGENSVGQLGLGHCEGIYTPTKITSLAGVEIEKIVCGRGHILALGKDGSLYTWGHNHHGQLGNGSTTTLNTPNKIPISLVGRVVDIAALSSSDICVALDERGRVFMWGDCRKQRILIPTCTPFSHIYDVLAYFATPSIMHEPLELHSEKGMSLLQCMRQGFDDANTSDLIIKVDNKEIHVHKAILQLRCTYYERMFQGDWAEKNQTLIEGKNYSYEAYRSFLKYLYTDEVETSAENALDLLQLADEYLDIRLKELCAKIVKKKISTENASFLYYVSVSYKIKELEEFCLRYILNNMKAVVKSSAFGDLDHSTMKRLLIRVADAGIFKT